MPSGLGVVKHVGRNHLWRSPGCDSNPKTEEILASDGDRCEVFKCSLDLCSPAQTVINQPCPGFCRVGVGVTGCPDTGPSDFGHGFVELTCPE